MRSLRAFILATGLLPVVLSSGLGYAQMNRSDNRCDPGTVSLGNDGTLVFNLQINKWSAKGPTTEELKLTYAPSDPSYRSMMTLSGDIKRGETHPLPSWHGVVGILRMTADGTIIYNERRSTSDSGVCMFETVFTRPGQIRDAYLAHVGGLHPGETKPVPEWPPSIGVAQMQPDGTIKMYLRITGAGGLVGDTVQTYRPGNPQYDDVLQHIGGIKPGEEKPVPPWTSEPSK